MKNLIKSLFTALVMILVSPLYLSYHLLALIFGKDPLIPAYTQFLSLFPGQTGNYIRKCTLRFILSHCSTNTVISFGVLMSHQDTEIHDGVYIGPQCNIGRSVIGANCLFGSGVHIISGKKQHNFDDLDTPIREQGGEFERVTIGEDTWIGNGALVMANVGKKCIIAAGSVVTQEVEDYSIVAGNPARVIKKRNTA
ncbi:MAG: acetyltransferase [Pseudomonadales bacterium]|jgi:virginiamycin A acetyltransferase|uniref:acyltransferase n=1 Tax=unclassified Ketobacter TaxID=2639109 RepID=UPI000C8B672B|nr:MULTISPECIES: acyltransferase [unclassified Ketobacter]MAA58658.1 acetyltransferase [Pseudomonadales bacterium]MEC8813857.1 acyltransferase [Pseudomonadota bacterium]TNC90871.1 MAG: acetyltransferase [Alcanivorax sp.]HAG92805.1 acetyltransferase [Gammaproteobacteria bacterium]MAQ24009.1 acetyltransferase [Pseudomonadales bacterium]|tara:strand:+ start:704 stop:1291 length:588 start_codon:yes stop_codon:yes gene_type:complete